MVLLRAQKHCEQYDRNALFKGSAQFKLQPVSRIVKVWFETITFGVVATRNVSVAYYCDKDPDPKLVEMRTNKSKENILTSQTLDYNIWCDPRNN